MNQLITAFKVFLCMTILTGLLYPLVITVVAQFTMPYLADGSLIKNGKQTIGSALIAQKTTGDNYFWPRPSAIDYDPMKPSGGSNLGPTSKKLKAQVSKRAQKLGQEAPHDLLYASASGLDPHISLDAAYFQMPRIAKARSISESELKNMIDIHSEKMMFISGPRFVNVLLLNQVLDDRRTK